MTKREIKKFSKLKNINDRYTQYCLLLKELEISEEEKNTHYNSFNKLYGVEVDSKNVIQFCTDPEMIMYAFNENLIKDVCIGKLNSTFSKLFSIPVFLDIHKNFGISAFSKLSFYKRFISDYYTCVAKIEHQNKLIEDVKRRIKEL